MFLDTFWGICSSFDVVTLVLDCLVGAILVRDFRVFCHVLDNVVVDGRVLLRWEHACCFKWMGGWRGGWLDG